MTRTLLIASAALFSTVALAGDPAPTVASAEVPATDAAEAEVKPEAVPSEKVKAFERLDTNDNDALSRVEVAQIEGLSADFAKLDADNDGNLSQTEFIAWIDEETAADSDK